MNKDNLYEEAALLFNTKKFQKALEIYLSILNNEKEKSQKIDLYAKISYCHSWLRNFEKADEYSKRCFEDNDNVVDSKFYRAFNHYINGRYDEAAKLLENLLRDNLKNFEQGILEAWYAKSLSASDKFDLAEKYFEIAYSRLDGTDNPFLYASILYEYGDTLYELEKYDQAIMIFSECDKYVPYLTPVATMSYPSMFARVLYQTKNYDRAYDISNKLLDLIEDGKSYDDEVKLVHYLLIAKIHVKKEEYVSALRILRCIEDNFADDWDEFEYLENMSISYHSLKQYVEAKKYLLQLSTTDIIKRIDVKEEYLYRKMLAVTLFELGEYQKAREIFRQLTILRDDNKIEDKELEEYRKKINDII